MKINKNKICYLCILFQELLSNILKLRSINFIKLFFINK